MKKIDEFMELFTEEVTDFKESVSRLKEVSGHIKDVKVKADSSIIEILLEEHLNKQEQVFENIEDTAIEIERQLQKSKVFPKWYLHTLLGMGITLTLILGYFGYHTYGNIKAKEKAYEAGKEEIFSMYKGFFQEHPNVYKDLQEWTKRVEGTRSK